MVIHSPALLDTPMSDSINPVALFTIEGLCETTTALSLVQNDGDPFSAANWTVDEFVRAFGIQASSRGFREVPSLYWRSFLEEMKLLLCTDDARHAPLRHLINTSIDKGQPYLVSTIAAGIAAAVSAPAAAVIAPLVAVLFIVVIRAGKQTFCQMTEEEIGGFRPFKDGC
jgi:hypothetical protein